MARHIGMIFGKTFRIFTRAVAAGVYEQSRSYQDWQFQFFGVEDGALDAMAKAGLDGVIAVGLVDEHVHLLKGLQRLSIPGVHAGELYTLPDFPQVTMPNTAVGELAARHLMERGLQHFAFVGQGLKFAQKRRKGFVQTLADAGFDRVPAFSSFDDDPAGLTEFLKQLPKPAGIMASSDGVGWWVTQAALRAGIHIPEQIALISVDNEDPLCTMATPPISSIDFPGRTMGRNAAVILENIMRGIAVPLRVNVESTRIVERQSTDVAITDKAEIAAAIRFIRRRQGIVASVGDIADAVGISRSTLERGFKLVLKRTPLQEMLRLRIDSAKDLLANTELPIKVIARRCGFADGKSFSTTIRKAFGSPPAQYRNNLRGQVAKSPASLVV